MRQNRVYSSGDRNTPPSNNSVLSARLEAVGVTSPTLHNMISYVATFETSVTGVTRNDLLLDITADAGAPAGVALVRSVEVRQLNTLQVEWVVRFSGYPMTVVRGTNSSATSLAPILSFFSHTCVGSPSDCHTSCQRRLATTRVR